jgi:hypothetical protein
MGYRPVLHLGALKQGRAKIPISVYLACPLREQKYRRWVARYRYWRHQIHLRGYGAAGIQLARRQLHTPTDPPILPPPLALPTL